MQTETLHKPAADLLPPIAPAANSRDIREGGWFDERTAQLACDFFPKFLRFTKDRWAGKPFVLEEWQKRDIIRPLFGWKRANGTRLYRRAIIFLPRKNGKTELAAGIALLLMFFDGLFGAEVYALASTESQARIVFDKASAMVGMNAELMKVAEPFKDKIYCAQTQSKFEPLDGKARGKHGLNASGIVADELHEWRNGDLYTFIHQSEASREQPVEVLISTAGVRGSNFGWEIWEEAMKIRDRKVEDPETLVVIYAAGPDEDWTAEETWRKANPNLGVSVSLDYLRSECRAAMGNPRRENDFRRYHLNQWVGQASRWLQMHKWDACAVSNWKDEDSLVGRPCFGGLDLSSNNDFTALAWAFPPQGDEKSWRRIYRYFIPEERVAERASQTGLPLERWIREGALQVTPGNSIDYAFIVDQILKDSERFDITMVGVDRWNCLHFTNLAESMGFPIEKIVKVGQGFASMSEPSKSYDSAVADGILDHGAHPITRWMADNVMILTDPAGNIKPAKNKSAEKIDGIVADIIAQFVALSVDTTVGVGVVEI